jgi:hypothetical protein
LFIRGILNTKNVRKQFKWLCLFYLLLLAYRSAINSKTVPIQFTHYSSFISQFEDSTFFGLNFQSSSPYTHWACILKCPSRQKYFRTRPKININWCYRLLCPLGMRNTLKFLESILRTYSQSKVSEHARCMLGLMLFAFNCTIFDV